MPRQLRTVVPDWPVHIVQRACDRMTCFHQEGDFLVYLALLRQAAEKESCNLHAYCLMSNHVHLLLTPSTPQGCSLLMKALAQRYSTYFNRTHRRTGPLWEGRFRSCVVSSSAYVLACYRYIELNPVRAGMVRYPADYLWSSYRINSGDRLDGMIKPHPEISALRPSGYRELLQDDVAPTVLQEIRDATNSGHSLSGGGSHSGKPGRPRKSVSDTDFEAPDLFSGGGAS